MGFGQKRIPYILLGLVLMLAMGACSSYQYKAVPIELPSSQAKSVSVDGVNISAVAYLSPEYAKARFGFDIRKAGLLPVQVVIDNQSGREVTIDPFQTFLIDNKGQAWPILPEQEAYNRIKEEVDVGTALKGAAKPAALLGAAGALLGFAVGIVSGHELGRNIEKGAVIGATAGTLAGAVQAYTGVETKIKRDLFNRSLESKPIQPGELAHGFLFFPGKQEAESASTLRLALIIGGEKKIVNVPLKRASHSEIVRLEVRNPLESLVLS